MLLDEGGVELECNERNPSNAASHCTRTVMPEVPSELLGDGRTLVALRIPPPRRCRPSFPPTDARRRRCLIQKLAQLLPGASLGSVSDSGGRP